MTAIHDSTDPRVAASLALLDEQRAALLAVVERIPDAERSRRPAADRWSPNEVLEHLATVEKGIGRLLALRGREAPGELPPMIADDELVRRTRSRAERIEAPERIRPKGELDTAAALQRLAETRAALKEAFLAADPASLDGLAHPHPIFGPLTLRTWVDFIAHHEARHAEQIAEMAGG